MTVRGGARGRGFTLIELVVTLAIVAVLASVALPMAELTVKRNKEQELRVALQQIREAIDAYKRASEKGKIEVSIDDSGYPKTLDDLVRGIEDVSSPDGRKLYFLRRLPRDPFARDPQLAATDTWGKRSYASSATDPQEGEDVFDVYTLNDGIGMNGIPYREW